MTLHIILLKKQIKLIKAAIFLVWTQEHIISPMSFPINKGIFIKQTIRDGQEPVEIKECQN